MIVRLPFFRFSGAGDEPPDGGGRLGLTTFMTMAYIIFVTRRS
jgi:hypothetical protein